MNEVRRSLVGSSGSRRAKAGRFTLLVVVVLLTWLAISWVIGRTIGG
jgi:hypothetical protein